MKSKFEQCKSCAMKCPSNIRMAKLNKGRIPFDKCMDYDQIKTNADRIRSMTNEELAEFLHNTYSYMRNGKFVLSLCIGSCNDIEIGDNFGDIKEWLESECDVE